MNTTEVWKPIKGYEGLYEISNFGRVKSYRNGGEMFMRQILDKDGYLIIGLKRDGHSKLMKVHRLVGMAFIPNPENKPHINHIDYNRSNNHVENLEWVTPKENTAHSLCHFPKEKKAYNPTGEKYVLYNKLNRNYRVKIGRKYYGCYQTIEKAVETRDKVLNGEEFVYERYTDFYKKPKKRKTNTGEHHIHLRKDGFYSVQYKDGDKLKSPIFRTFKQAIEFRDKIYEKHNSNG